MSSNSSENADDTAPENQNLRCRNRMRNAAILGFFAIGIAIAMAFILRPSSSPTPVYDPLTGNQCFRNNAELVQAVRDFVMEDRLPNDVDLSARHTAQKWGWPLSEWCVSNVILFDFLLSGVEWDLLSDEAAAQLQGISQWDVSHVDRMVGLFQQSSDIKIDLNSWDTSGVFSMKGLLANTVNFQGKIDGWDTSRVVDMSGMFLDADIDTSVNDFSLWDTSNVAILSQFLAVYHGLTPPRGIEAWNVARVRRLNQFASVTSHLHLNLTGWHTGRVQSLSEAFIHTHNVSVIGLAGWNVSSLVDVTSTFFNASDLLLDTEDGGYCSWGPTLAANNAQATKMFQKTSCPQANVDPDLRTTPPGPFCNVCI